MKRFTWVLLVALVAGVVFPLAGCMQSKPAQSSANMTPAGMKYVYVEPTGNGQPYVVAVTPDGTTNVLAKPGAATCEQCVADAKTYALTGQMDPVCKMCGARRTPVTASTGSPQGHN